MKEHEEENDSGGTDGYGGCGCDGAGQGGAALG